MNRVPIGINDGGWCPVCRGPVWFMSGWRGHVGLYISECKTFGERRAFGDTNLAGAINALVADGGVVTRKAWMRAVDAAERQAARV